MKFLKPATGTISVEITLSEEKIQALEDEAAQSGKAEFVLEGQLKNASGEVVAVSHGIYQLRKKG